LHRNDKKIKSRTHSLTHWADNSGKQATVDEI